MLATTVPGCGAADLLVDSNHATLHQLTGISGTERGIHFTAYLYLPAGASDETVRTAIARQLKTALGALRFPGIGLGLADAGLNFPSSAWQREPMAVVEPGAVEGRAQEVVRIRYRYDDRAVVSNALLDQSAVELTMLAREYGDDFALLSQACSYKADVSLDSLWYHFFPQSASCQQHIEHEALAIAAEHEALGDARYLVGSRERNRLFLTVTAHLDPPAHEAKEHFPEYHRLWGLDEAKDTLVVYAFLGVHGTEYEDAVNPRDPLAREAMRFLRTMLRGQPAFRPTHTDPFAWLQDIDVDGNPVAEVTYEAMLSWVIDANEYPIEARDDPQRIARLRREVLAKFAERWIYWDLPLLLTRADGSAKQVTAQVRFYYGREEGDEQIQHRARERYLEALRRGDVLLYSGHSHFGHGPLAPTGYEEADFSTRYQIILINSCMSFNYYREGFLSRKPGGSAHLDMVVNALPSYIAGGGIAAANFVLALLAEAPQSYRDILTAMRVDLSPWAPQYEPMRVVDGELDNVFDPAVTPFSVSAPHDEP